LYIQDNEQLNRVVLNAPLGICILGAAAFKSWRKGLGGKSARHGDPLFILAYQEKADKAFMAYLFLIYAQ
jgi:hypothetical protein